MELQFVEALIAAGALGIALGFVVIAYLIFRQISASNPDWFKLINAMVAASEKMTAAITALNADVKAEERQAETERATSADILRGLTKAVADLSTLIAGMNRQVIAEIMELRVMSDKTQSKASEAERLALIHQAEVAAAHLRQEALLKAIQDDLTVVKTTVTAPAQPTPVTAPSSASVTLNVNPSTDKETPDHA